MHFAGYATFGARERAPRRKVDLDVESLSLGVQFQLHHLPGADHAKGYCKQRIHIEVRACIFHPATLTRQSLLRPFAIARSLTFAALPAPSDQPGLPDSHHS